ncbi:MAG: hypothetical protein HOK98_16465 [Rhodospirillaceae bacterium]|nr:hypothetical protein [Rhodospirillaceae bacterium]MBT5943318.1 hypothetical protein [Rhodospirillaceae bacterium]MBT6404793.1 hypothetical protein [Rhodospirillaceae bacterium]MBT6537767.1 hypothetical protein [Rhodospirillaceae bacterium]
MRHLKSGLMIAAALMLAALPAPAFAGAIHKDVPEKVDPDKRYLIYLHGAWLESHALSEPHPKRGVYQYEKILAELAARDFEVISELRVGKPNPRKYTRTRVIPQINALLEKGVPANRITVVGFSKGGTMTLVLSAQAGKSGLNIVNLAGCGKGRFRAAYDSFLKNDASKMQGRMLSLYDPADLIAGTCEEAAKLGARLKMTEVALKAGKGHATFYSPNPAWLDRIASWSAAAGKPKTN